MPIHDADQTFPPAPISADYPTHEDIACRAYERFVTRGGEPGLDLDDWLEAERELLHAAVMRTVQPTGAEQEASV